MIFTFEFYLELGKVQVQLIYFFQNIYELIIRYNGSGYATDLMTVVDFELHGLWGKFQSKSFPHMQKGFSLLTAFLGSIISNLPAPQAISTTGKGAIVINTAGILLKKRAAGVLNRIRQIKRHELLNNISFLGIRHFHNDIDPLQGFQQGHLRNISAAHAGLPAPALGCRKLTIKDLQFNK